MKKGDQFIETVTSFDQEGRGICRIDGFAIFVEGAVLGDVISLIITKLNKTYGFGKLQKIVKPSPYRIEPNCPYFDLCGACSLLHISYAAQLNMKQDIVKNALTHIGGFSDISVEKTVGMQNPYYYRNKSQFPVCANEKGFVIGFYQKNSHYAIDMTSCRMSSRLSIEIVNFIRQFMKENAISAYHETTHRGCMRHIFVRTTAREKKAMVLLVTSGKTLPHAQKLTSELTTRFPQIVSLYQNINTKRTNLILGQENVLLYGEKVIYDTLLQKKFMISPFSFYQINHEQTEKLYQKAIHLADITKDDVVFDLYCGIGTISLCMAPYAKKVIGVEIVEDAILNAKQNAKLNGIENTEFYAGKAEEVVLHLYREGKRADIVVLDPPRKGADSVLLDTILSMQPKKIVYISCNPATLARDMRVLCKGGYGAKNVYPYDMFCHTGHVECVCLLTKEK